MINKHPSEAEKAHNVRRATQDYGAWPQRRLAYTGKTQKAANGKERVTKPAVPDLPKYDDAQEEAFQTIRGVFFALQGDPILSRLFCLALDFEADAKAFLVGHYHLAVGFEGGGCARATILSAEECSKKAVGGSIVGTKKKRSRTFVCEFCTQRL
ncbi:hypothetical protein NKG95_02980 [Mesorhizobium sp. M1423]|uniref:hypothetical protein n=1 Tax=Mesorhizobium sp. M1423 TaxID=2957101 RepID=UPI003339EC85